MKISDIKTESEFYEFADIWYQRARRLRSIYNDKRESIERRQKAFELWAVMADRVMKLVKISIKTTQYNSPNFKEGGVSIV